MITEIPRHITKFACARTPAQWWGLVFDGVEKIRLLIRENGEKAAVFGFVFGMALIMLFKVFVVLAALVALVFLSLVAISEHYS